MTQTQDHSDVLDRFDAAATAGTALDALPDDWRFFISGPDDTGFACAMLPPDANGAPRRIYRRGLAMGTGATRLEAMKAASAWLRERLSWKAETVEMGEDA